MPIPVSKSSDTPDVDLPPPSKRILFDSTFDSSVARDLAELLEEDIEAGQILDNEVVFPIRCSDEIEKECNVPVSMNVENVGPEIIIDWLIC